MKADLRIGIDSVVQANFSLLHETCSNSTTTYLPGVPMQARSWLELAFSFRQMAGAPCKPDVGLSG